MRVMVTGAAGFIGSNLVAELLRRGYEVTGLDNLSQGTTLNLTEVLENPGFTFHEGDIREEEAVARASSGCGAVVHLAAYKIPRYSDAYETLMINAIGSENVARVAARSGAKVVAASTSDAYGKSPDVPFEEEGDSVIGSPHVKRWAYAVSKMFEEQLLLACAERFGLDVVLLRLFGCYGPHQALSWWGGPQSVFIDKALNDEPMPLHGDGAQTRTFTYVDDHVAAMIAAVERPQANNLVINIGSTREISIEALARLVWELIHGPESVPKFDVIPYAAFGRYEDVRRRVPSVVRAREVLGFEATMDLETGLRKTIDWQVERHRQLGHEVKRAAP